MSSFRGLKVLSHHRIWISESNLSHDTILSNVKPAAALRKAIATRGKTLRVLKNTDHNREIKEP